MPRTTPNTRKSCRRRPHDGRNSFGENGRFSSVKAALLFCPSNQGSAHAAVRVRASLGALRVEMAKKVGFAVGTDLSDAERVSVTNSTHRARRNGRFDVADYKKSERRSCPDPGAKRGSHHGKPRSHKR